MSSTKQRGSDSALFKTALGWVGIAWNAQGLTRVVLPCDTRGEALERIGIVGSSRKAARPAWVSQSIEKLKAHLQGRAQDFSDIPLELAPLSDFARQVYLAAQRVGSGQTLSYGELARKLGTPGAARAVGRALGANPFPIVVPCHRVLASGGELGGFSAPGGIATKVQLLELEQLSAVAQSSSLSSSSLVTDALPFDPEHARAHLIAKDPKLRKLIDRVGPLELKLRPAHNIFFALGQSIVYQQLTGKAAGTIWGRVQALHPEWAPEAVLGIPDTELRKAGLSQNKLRSLKDLARRIVEGSVPALEALHALPDAEIIERLTEVRGIGRWTVEMLLIFRLGRPDILPLQDYGVRKGFAVTFKTPELPTPAELSLRGERWKPYRSAAAWYLWRAAESAPRRVLEEKPKSETKTKTKKKPKRKT